MVCDPSVLSKVVETLCPDAFITSCRAELQVLHVRESIGAAIGDLVAHGDVVANIADVVVAEVALEYRGIDPTAAIDGVVADSEVNHVIPGAAAN